MRKGKSPASRFISQMRLEILNLLNRNTLLKHKEQQISSLQTLLVLNQ